MPNETKPNVRKRQLLNTKMREQITCPENFLSQGTMISGTGQDKDVAFVLLEILAFEGLTELPVLGGDVP